jgi:hypothetical protein
MPKTCEPAAVDECPRTFFGCSEIIRPSAVSDFRWERPYRTRFVRSRDVAAGNEDKIYFLRLCGGVGSVPSEWGFSRCVSREVVQGSYAMPSCR